MAIAYRSGSATTQNFVSAGSISGTPSNTQSGDYTFAFVACNSTTTIASTPAGWTLLQSAAAIGNAGVAIFGRLWSGTPTSSTWNLSPSSIAVLGFISFSGVDTTNPIIASTLTEGVNATSHLSDFMTNTVADTMSVGWFGVNRNADTTWVPRTGYSLGVKTDGVAANSYISGCSVYNLDGAAADRVVGAVCGVNLIPWEFGAVLRPLTTQTYDETTTTAAEVLAITTGTVGDLTMDTTTTVAAVLNAITTGTDAVVFTFVDTATTPLLVTSLGTDTATFALDQQEALLVALTGGSDTTLLVETSDSVQAIVEALSSIEFLTMDDLGSPLLVYAITEGLGYLDLSDLTGSSLLLAVLSGADELLGPGSQVFDETGHPLFFLLVSTGLDTLFATDLSGDEISTVITSGPVDGLSMTDLTNAAIISAITSGTSEFIIVDTTGLTVVNALTTGTSTFAMGEIATTAAVMLATTTGTESVTLVDLLGSTVQLVTTTGSDTSVMSDLDSPLLIYATFGGFDGGANDELTGEVLVLVVTSGTDSRILRRLSIYTRSMLVSEQPYRASTLHVESPYTRSTLHTQQPFDQSLLAAG